MGEVELPQSFDIGAILCNVFISDLDLDLLNGRR